MRLCFFTESNPLWIFVSTTSFVHFKNLQYQIPQKWTLLVNFVLCLILLICNWLDTYSEASRYFKNYIFTPFASSITLSHLKIRRIQFISPNFICLKVIISTNQHLWILSGLYSWQFKTSSKKYLKYLDFLLW